MHLDARSVAEGFQTTWQPCGSVLGLSFGHPTASSKGVGLGVNPSRVT